MARKEFNIKQDGLTIKEDDTKIYIYTTWYSSRYSILRLFNRKEDKLRALFIKMSSTETVFFKFFLPEVVMLLKAALRLDNKYGIKVERVEEMLAYLDPTTKVEEILDYSIIDRKFKFKILDHQRPIFENYKNTTQVLGYRGMLVEAAVGSGKAQPLYSRIRTPDGWTTMGDIQVGDTVIAQDGTPTIVKAIFPQKEKQMVYAISIGNDRIVHATGEHLWKAWVDNKEGIYTTHGLITRVEDEFISNVEIPVIEDITVRSKDIDLFNPPLDIHPALLGYLTASTSTLFTSYMLFRINELYNSIAILKQLSINNDFSIDEETNVEYLKTQSLWESTTDTRYIPKEYLYGPGDVRKDFIMGFETSLLDNKLMVCKDGIKYITIPYLGDSKLRDNIIEMYYSLGYDVEFEDIVLHMDTTGNVDKGTALRVKKVDRLKINSIVPIGEMYTKCISIDHPSRLYITDNYIVTHNTFSSLAISEALAVDNIIVVCPLPTLDKVWVKSIYDDAENCYKEKQSYMLVTDGSYRGERFILCHYEALDKLQKIIPAICRNKVSIIVDECHNFANSNSKRTELLVSLVDSFINVDVLLLSGTPIKASYKEIGNILRLLSKDFSSSHIEKRFHGLYKFNNETTLEFLNARYQRMTTKIAKDNLNLKPMSTMYIKVPMDKNISNKYTLATIKDELKKFMESRLKELNDNKEHYHNEYNILYNKAVSLNNGKISKTEKLVYERNVAIIQKTKDYSSIKDIVASANRFENTYLLPVLHGEDKSKFRELKTIYKYPILKVIGEGLGQVILRKRIDCHKELIKNLKLNSIVDSTNKKTLIFSSYIECCEEAISTCKKFKYNPLEVFGSSTKDLNSTVNKFLNDKKANPLVTTYKSLSTGVPLTVANIVVCIDLPYRMYIYEQAIGRVWRLGQDKNVIVYILQLDTGELPNINTRNIDIIKFFKEEVEKITGVASSIDIDVNNVVDGGSEDGEDYLVNVTKDELTFLLGCEKSLKPYFYDNSNSVISRW